MAPPPPPLAGINLLKDSKRNTRTRCEMLFMKYVKYALVFLLLTLNM